MAWTAPRTWVTAELVVAAHMNEQIRDNMLQTSPAKVTTAGDILYASAANTLARLGIGTAGQVLKVNAGATAPEWESPASAATASALVRRDSSGRARFADPDDNGDAANKGWVYSQVFRVHSRELSTTTIVNTAAESILYAKEITANLLGASGGFRLKLGGDYLNNTGLGKDLTLKLVFGTTTLFERTITPATSADRRKWSMDVLLFNSATNLQRALSRWTLSEAASTAWAPVFNLGQAYEGYSTAAEDTTAARNIVLYAQHGDADASLDIRMHMAILEVIATA